MRRFWLVKKQIPKGKNKMPYIIAGPILFTVHCQISRCIALLQLSKCLSSDSGSTYPTTT